MSEVHRYSPIYKHNKPTAPVGMMWHCRGVIKYTQHDGLSVHVVIERSEGANRRSVEGRVGSHSIKKMRYRTLVQLMLKFSLCKCHRTTQFRTRWLNYHLFRYPLRCTGRENEKETHKARRQAILELAIALCLRDLL